MKLDLARLDATETISAIRDGALSPVEYAEALVDRAAAHADLNALMDFDGGNLVRVDVEADDVEVLFGEGQGERQAHERDVEEYHAHREEHEPHGEDEHGVGQEPIAHGGLPFSRGRR